MIVTAQPVLNELDLLEVKFEELKGVVDCHVVVESDLTYTGLPKPLWFLNNKERFAQYPIFHYIARLPEITQSPWQREEAMHREIARCVSRLNPEIVMWLDADEVPRRNVVERFLAMKERTAILEMDQINFYFNRRCTWMKWRFPKISRYVDGDTSRRNETQFPVLPDAGWHFQNFGPKEAVLDKLKSFSHAHDDSTAEFRSGIVFGDKPGLEPCEPYDDLPAYVLENRQKFHQHFL